MKPVTAAPAGIARDPVVRDEADTAPRIGGDWTVYYDRDSIRRYAVKWRYQTARGDVSGRATVTVLPPDTIDLTYSAPFGRRGRARFAGLRAVVAEPPEDADRFADFAVLAWGALGIPWTPVDGRGVVGHVQADRRTWQLVVGDTVVTYVRWEPGDPSFTTQVRVGQQPVGSARATLDPETGALQRGHMRLIRPDAFMLLEVVGER